MKKLFLAVCCFFSLSAHAQGTAFDRLVEMAVTKGGEVLAKGGDAIGKMDLPTVQGTSSSQSVPAGQKIEVAFSPNQGGEALVIKAIQSAKKNVRLAAYSFTSKPITQALIAAKKRGVDVKMIVDHKNNFDGCGNGSTKRCSGAAAVSAAVNAGIDARVVSKYAIFHHKFIVIDGTHLETGSFNFSAAAEKSNAENVLVMWNNPQLAETFLAQWNKHWAEGEKVPMAY